ncbi:hypothetical protein OG239_05115 [Streptomyces sp. NBC_00868]|uniref:hypothetical protein n=1 Tax=Streptomyces sp. NBC_00868 TaxID=2903683 RepID=UPI00386C879A|nr:hypothetical protein OG239_05115 [Streptomyces sp. NBC_00868]
MTSLEGPAPLGAKAQDLVAQYTGAFSQLREGLHMGSVVVGVIGTLIGVTIGVVAQQAQAIRNHTWQREDVLSSAKRAVYAEYLRSISVSYAQAISDKKRTRTEDAHLLAATAELEILSEPEVAEVARDLANRVMAVHERIADGGAPKAHVDAVDRRRLEIVDLFKADLGLPTRASAAHGPGTFPLPGGADKMPFNIATGPDQNVWFTELLGNAIGRVEALPGQGAGPHAADPQPAPTRPRHERPRRLLPCGTGTPPGAASFCR